LLFLDILKFISSSKIKIFSKTNLFMPFVQINTSSKSILDNNLLQKEISKMIADLTRKSENYVMTMIESNSKMTFAGSDEPCCFIKIKSIGSLNPSLMSKSLCELIESKTNIKANRIYLEFIDVDASNWGFNSSTFG